MHISYNTTSPPASDLSYSNADLITSLTRRDDILVGPLALYMLTVYVSRSGG